MRLEADLAALQTEKEHVRQEAEQARRDQVKAAIAFQNAKDLALKAGVNAPSENGHKAAPVQLQEPQQPWSFSFMPSLEGDVSIALPSDPEKFIEVLQREMEEARYHDLDSSMIYRKLIPIMGKTAQQRNSMKKMIYRESGLDGWVNTRVGKRAQHRLFLLIDESRRHMFLHLRPRDKAYPKKSRNH